MKKSQKIALCCLAFVLMFAGFARAQKTQTITGYFCGMSEGDGGFPAIRVGKKVVTFSIYGDEPEIKYVGFRNKSLWKLRVGSELIVGFAVKRKYGSPEKIVRSLTLTGKVNARTQSCGFGDE
jgi:hypothetical protein